MDNAATAQIPSAALQAMDEFNKKNNANVHRGMHVLAERATIAYESARACVKDFLNASRPEEIIFTKNCTEGINLVAKSWGRSLKAGDVIVLSLLEHHSNIVPWMQLKEEIGIELKWLDIDEKGHLDLDQYKKYLAEGNVKMVAITGQSNSLGIRPPINEMIADAHQSGALCLVDAAQLAAHHKIDVQDLDCDFLTFSGHKTYGPFGIGVLYGKRALLESMPPFLSGGMMIQEVNMDTFTSAEIPAKFEAGTPPVAQATGLEAAIKWMGEFDWKDIESHERELLDEAIAQLKTVDGLTILGPVEPQGFSQDTTRISHDSLTAESSTSDQNKNITDETAIRTDKQRTGAATEISGCVNFVIDGIHPHDLTEIIGRKGVCMRAGHHCNQPLHKALNQVASTRLSVGIYNTKEEIALAVEAIKEALKTFS